MKFYTINWNHKVEVGEEALREFDRIMSKRPVAFCLNYTGYKKNGVQQPISIYHGKMESADEVWVCFDKLIMRISIFGSILDFKNIIDPSTFGFKLLLRHYTLSTKAINYRVTSPDFILEKNFFNRNDTLDSIKMKIIIGVSKSG